MVDHEGHVKEILWKAAQTGRNDYDVFPVVADYLPENAPERLLPRACDPATCAALAAPAVSPMSAMEAALAAALLGMLLAWIYSLLMLDCPPQPDTPATADDPSAPILLADFARTPQPGGPTCSNSSYVTKVEAFLRFAGIPYLKQVGYPSAAASPKAQLPYIERGGQHVGDSYFIIKHLISSGTVPAALEFPPAAKDRAAAIAIARMCDTDLAAAIVYYRWVDDEGWARCRGPMLGPFRMPPAVHAVVSRMARKASHVRCVEQGFGCHSEADRLGLVAEELGALSQLLGDRPFLFGDRPHAVDASAFGVLDQLAARPLNPQLADLLEAHPNLVGYRERIRAEFFGPGYEDDVVWLDGSTGSSDAVAARHVGGGGGDAAKRGQVAAAAASRKLHEALHKEE